jgi:phage terminase large subunit
MRKVQSNVIFKHLELSQKRIVIEQGGTRSGKTYNILLWIIFSYCMRNQSKVVTIARKTYPALRSTAMRDFINIVKDYGIYSELDHNKSNSEYVLNGNLVEFISLDQPTKVRGRKRDLLFINEANELFFEDWQQLIFRTTGKIILDYNPSDEFHWIYDRVKVREDAEFHITTYKDNPFLESQIIQEIERLKDVDENYWKIYGLGQVGTAKSLIFNFNLIDTIPENAKFISYGLDFGFTNDPTALVKVYLHDTNLYVKELLYRTGMTNQDIAKELDRLEIGRREEIFADASEPKSIEEIYRMGWNIKKADKPQGSVNLGIDMLRRYTLNVTKDSLNLIKEGRNYKYKEDKNGNILNEPADAFNHTMDALRYAIFMKLSKPNYGKYAIH